MRQPSCAEISRLPKLTEGIKSINFRRTTPGSIYRVVHAHKPPPSNSVLDPTHPALTYRQSDFLRAFPWRSYDGFNVRAIPHGLLEYPTTSFPSPPYKLSRGPSGGRSVNMSLLDIAPRNVGGHVVRQDVLRKLKTAISLIVTRGADVEGPEGNKKVVFKGADASDAWILPNWVYIVRPHNVVYNMPYARLIPGVRDALQVTVSTGKRLEKQWTKMKEVIVQSPESEQPFKRLHLPSKPPPEPSEKEKAVQQTFTQALQRLSRPVPDPSQPQQGSGSEKDAPPQKPSTLADILDRHLKRGLADSDWGTPLEGPYVASREPRSNLPSTLSRRDSS